MFKPTHLLIVLTVLACGFAIPPVGHAASSDASFELSGWLPYWKTSDAIKEARKYIDELDQIHPFAFGVKANGTLNDQAKLSKSTWKRLFKEARTHDVRIVPTIMSSDAALIHELLSDKDEREDHITAIVKMVEKGKYDGVDIDYENKWAETRPYFSLFLEELKAELEDKLLTCTVEARTPPASLYRTIPANLEYANDYVEINKHCDQVTIMAYDQGRADYKLNDAKSGAPYIPVADSDWVKKVIDETAKTISKDKLVLGIPTYGYEYEVTVAPNWFKDYTKLWSLNPGYAEETYEDLDITPSRGKSGELSFSYIPEDSTYTIPSSIKAPRGTPSGEVAAARALAYANATGNTVKVNYVTWSDADAITEKINLAESMGLKGASIFKIDGGAENFWSDL